MQFPNVMNMFNGPDAQPAPVAPDAQAPVGPAATSIPNTPTTVPASGPNTAPNAVVPADPNAPPGQTPSDQNADQSPLAEFTALWDTKPVDPNAPAPVDPLAIDATQLQEHVAKINFAESVTPELLQKVTAGGEEAAGALLEALNSVARNVLAQSTLVSNKLAQRASTHEANAVQNSVQETIKKYQVTQNLSNANPLFDHPAVAPVIATVKEQLSVKHPAASPAQLTEMAQNFVMAMSNSFNPQQTPQTDAQAAEFPDFDKFMGS